VAVSQTTYIALNKPDDTELAKNWARLTQLQDDNNTKIETGINVPLTAYTPVLTAATTAPNMGTGVGAGAVGQYQNYNGIIQGSFVCSFVDTGVAVGSGEYAVSLPFPVDATFHSVGTSFAATPGSFSVVGEGYYLDISAVATSGSAAIDVVTVSGVSYVRFLTEVHTTPAKTSRLFKDSMPFAVATGDCLSGNFIYKKA
jgi:hypothetical protein